VTIKGADIDEKQLEALIPNFYARVRQDALIGPVFNGAISDWDDHLEKLIAFWSSVMLTSGRYKGNPVAAHMKQGGAITPPMFDRWLSLWAEVTEEILPAPAAAALQDKAARIAESLKLALYFRLPPTPGSRPISPKPRLERT
jgi:hemoglobin